MELAPISKFLPFAPIQKKSVDATDQYTDLLWEGVQTRLPYTDLSNSPCAFSEAPAEGIFSIFSRVCRGRESLTIAHATALTRIAAHGPPAATKDAAEIAKKALENYKSQFGERFCTTFWRPGSTSNVLSGLKQKKWQF